MAPFPFDADKIAVIGVPSSAGARRKGQELAPPRLREAGLVDRLRLGGREVLDLGDVRRVVFSPDPSHPKRQNLAPVLGVLSEVSGAVDAALAERAWPLVLGGDCTITIGVLAALSSHFERLGLAYVDGDVDLNTPDTTHTGILDGMVLAHLLGRGVAKLSRFGPRHPLLDEREVALFGYSLRAGGVDAAEVDLLRSTRMAKYPMEQVEGRATAAAADAVAALERQVEHYLVHLDVDVVDFEELPAVDVPHQPGLRLADVAEALEVLVGSPQAVGLVVTEFNAKEDVTRELAPRVNGVIQRAIGVGFDG